MDTMKTRFGRVKLALTTLALMSAAAGAHAQTIYVSQVGATGSTTVLSSSGTALFLNQFNTSGTSVAATLNLTTAGGNTLVNSGSAGSEGGLTLSGNYLTFVGYDTAVGTASVVGTTSASVPRGVGIYNLATRNVNTSTALTDAYSGNNIRTAVTTDGTNIFTAGATGGIRQTTTGATTSTVVESLSGNTRYVGAYNGNTYFSTGSATGVGAVGIYRVTSDPAAPAAVVSDAVNLSSPYDFVFANNGGTLYVSDSSKGLVKYNLVNNVYTFANAFNTGITGGLYGLAFGGTDATGNNILYAITGGSSSVQTSLVSLDDTGIGASFTTLASAPTNTAFRGVAFAPAPEPGSVTALLLGAGLLGLVAIRRRRAA